MRLCKFFDPRLLVIKKEKEKKETTKVVSFVFGDSVFLFWYVMDYYYLIRVSKMVMLPLPPPQEPVFIFDQLWLFEKKKTYTNWT